MADGIYGTATLGDQTTTNVSYGSYEDNGNTVYYVSVHGLTNEGDQSPLSMGTLTLNEYSGGTIVETKTLNFYDPVGVAREREFVGEYVSSNDGATYEITVHFESSIVGTATLGTQTTTNVDTDSYQAADGTLVYSITIYGLTNEGDQSPPSMGTLVLTKHIGGNVVNDETFDFEDPVGIVSEYKFVGEYVSSNDGVTHEIYIYFESSIVGTATLGTQTTVAVASSSYEDSGVTSYRIEVYGLTNETDQSPLSEGSVTLTEYSEENVVKEETLNFDDPMGEDASTWESLAGFTDSSGVVYDVFIYFEPLVPP